MLLLLCCVTTHAQVSYLDRYLTDSITLTVIGAGADQLNQPRDLDFKPNSNELWVCNYGTEEGGFMVIFYNAGLPNQSSEYRKDAWYQDFLMYPTAIAFGEDGFWANSNEVRRTGSATIANSTYMGPTLWSADTSVFARVFQKKQPGFPFGSHYAMIHQSPFAMGIAHDTNLVYWVSDGFNGNICRYDFTQHGGPGDDDHRAGKIWRYTDVAVSRIARVPSHMVMDKKNGWLYFTDAGTNTLRRLNTRTGTIAGTIEVPATAPEALSGYQAVNGATVEILDTFLTVPCGVDLYQDWLVVSDYNTGDLYLYRTGAAVTLVKTIHTGRPGMMGLKVGPDERIWCVNGTESRIYRLDVLPAVTDAAVTAITSPAVVNFKPTFYATGYNSCDTVVSPVINILNKGSGSITKMDLEYTIDTGMPVPFTWSGTLTAGNNVAVSLPASAVAGGPHLLKVNIKSVNDSIDEVSGNNSIEGSFRAIGTVSAYPFSENFSSATFPPAGWNYIHYNPNNQMGYVTTGGFGNNTGALKMDNFSGEADITGQVDYLMTPAIDFTQGSALGRLSFNVAYAPYSVASKDRLEVLVSADCGGSWLTVYDKAGMELATAPASTVNWSPAAAQWRFEGVPLSAVAGASRLILLFKTTSNFGNNLYLDDIRIDNTTGIDEKNNPDHFVQVYPNPSAGLFTISMKEITPEDLYVHVYSFDGRLVQTRMIPAGSTQMQLDLSGAEPGMYALRLGSKSGSFSQSRMLSITH